MTEPTIRLPPLNALRVFQVVVKRRSFRAAAEELLVSPQAVSLQIKLLEEALGLVLFDRKGRTVEPNAQAILLAHHVQAGFDEFAEGVRRVTRAATRSRINLNASPYFATRYLLDRIASFRDLLPGVDLRLTTNVELPDFVADEVDVAIQWGFGAWPKLECKLLLPDYKVICCTPSLALHLKRPDALRGQTLLHPVLSDRLWGRILVHLGVEGEPAQTDIRIQDAAAMRRATLAGLGVGLISTVDAEEDIRAGKLVAPFGTQVMASMPAADVPGFYLVLPRSHRRAKPVAAFCDWVEGEDWQKRMQEHGTAHLRDGRAEAS